MKVGNVLKVSLVALAGVGFVLGQDEPAEGGAPAEGVAPAPEPKLSEAEVKPLSSYAFGYQMGRQLNEYGLQFSDISMEDFNKGFEAATKGEKPGMDVVKLQAAMPALQELLQKREIELAKTNLEAGKKFLEENGKKEGVITTASGLQYEILAKGGDKKYDPSMGESKLFMVHYRGTLIDGTEFDKSPEGEPFPMPLQVVPGFREALTTMPVGAKWKIFLSSGLAYGEQRGSALIGPNSTLIFELELVEIKDAPPQQDQLPFPVPQE